MVQERKEYRKSYNSSGQIFIAGELLDFISYDVSVAGICIEVVPGLLLSEISDFEALLKENDLVELYVKDLMLTGEANIVWVKQDKGKILLGLEFRDVMYNAEKLWRTRRFYRSAKAFTGYVVVNDQRVDFTGINVSVDGLAIQLKHGNSQIESGDVIKLLVNEFDIKGLGKVIWVKSLDANTTELGLRYLNLD